jgi:four helix bundle protein
MATIKRFYDLEVWKKARALNVGINKMLLKEVFRKNFVLVDQIQRASISVMANIAEGFGRKGNKEFVQFLSISHGSLTELQSHLFICLDLHKINDVEFELMNSIIEDVQRMIHALMDYLSKSEYKGVKFA